MEKLIQPGCVDYAVKIRVNPQQTGIDTNVKHSMVSSFAWSSCILLTPVTSRRTRLMKSVRRQSVSPIFTPPQSLCEGVADAETSL